MKVGVPAEPVLTVRLTGAGAKVSVKVGLAVLPLPAASWAPPAATATVTEPAAAGVTSKV